MPKDPLIRVRHVLEEIAFLQSLKHLGSAANLAADAAYSRAAAYSLQNISEAVRNIPDDMLTSVTGIEWAKIKGLGNITRHEYFRIDPIILWETICNDLDELREAMNALIQKFGHPAS
jgi:uncharacterized protein with HEPN domain